MNQFIEECRREWKRLRVPDPVANEMAADLAADLEEAESEGASAEELLGSGSSDPRSFAASWAAERGVIPAPPLAARPRTRSLIHAALAALTIITAVGAALEIFASPHDSAPDAAIRILPTRPPSGTPSTVTVRSVYVPSQLGGGEANGSGVDIQTVGSILLIVGVVGITLSMLFLFWLSRVRPDHWARRRAYIDRATGGPGYY